MRADFTLAEAQIALAMTSNSATREIDQAFDTFGRCVLCSPGRSFKTLAAVMEERNPAIVGGFPLFSDRIHPDEIIDIATALGMAPNKRLIQRLRPAFIKVGRAFAATLPAGSAPTKSIIALARSIDDVMDERELAMREAMLAGRIDRAELQLIEK